MAGSGPRPGEKAQLCNTARLDVPTRPAWPWETASQPEQAGRQQRPPLSMALTVCTNFVDQGQIWVWSDMLDLNWDPAGSTLTEVRGDRLGRRGLGPSFPVSFSTTL